jgi:hypothetical protein
MEVSGRHARTRARSLATRFLLQIGLFLWWAMRRKASRVSFLMCPICVRVLLSVLTTENAGCGCTDDDYEPLPIDGAVSAAAGVMGAAEVVLSEVVIH